MTVGRTSCPICGRGLDGALFQAPNHDLSHLLIDCHFCGLFIMTEEAVRIAVDQMNLPGGQGQTLPIAHAIRCLQRYRQNENEPPIITAGRLDQWWHSARLPSPAGILDNLVMLLGDLGKADPGAKNSLTWEDRGAALGAASDDALSFVVRQGVDAGIIDHGINGIIVGDQRVPIGRLTLAGWQRYDALQKGETSSQTAFMAMQFGAPNLDSMVDTWFRPAVEATGFRLKRLDEGQPAGLIDDHLRVEIKRARFLIADLSHHNNGAYWEAGYAEGLGKPVIYTCEKSVFDDKSKGTHFDTNHHLTVVWEPEKPEEAARKLKDTIRATLPDARMDAS